MAQSSDSIAIDMSPLLERWYQIEQTMEQIQQMQSTTFTSLIDHFSTRFVSALNGSYFKALQDTQEELVKTQRELANAKETIASFEQTRARVRFSIETEYRTYFGNPSPSPKPFRLQSPPILPTASPDSPV